MIKILNIISVVSFSFILIIISSCTGNSTKENNTTAKDTVTVTWLNPRKGKIWEKENIVKIPLTAVENGFIGSVKSVSYKEFEYPDKEGDTSKSLVDTGYNVYDKAGHLVDQNEYSDDNEPKWHCIYKYDAQNKPNEWDLNIYDDEMVSQTTFKYDAKGNKTEEVTTDTNKKLMGKINYKYDDRGNVIETSIFDKDGQLKQVISYQYDKRNFQMAYFEKGPDGEVFSKLTCEYDDNGNKTGGADYSSDTDMENKWVQKNDEMGRRIETDYFLPDGTLLEKRTIKYENNFPVEYNTYKRDGTLDELKSYSYKNEYDKTGNIIKQTEIRWKGGKRVPATFAEYVITYY